MVAEGFGAASKVSKAGDTMTGTLVLGATPPLQAPAGATSGYVLGTDGSGNASWVPAGGSTTVIDGVTVSGAAASGKVLTATSASAADWQTPAAGNVIDGVTVSGTPSSGEVLTATSPTAADWQVPSAGTVISGITVSGTPSTGMLLTATSASAADWQNPASGAGVTLDTTSADIQALGSQAAGSVGQAADAGHVHPTTGVALLAGATFTGAVAPAVAALTDGSSIAVNAALGNVFTVTIAGNRTLANPSNPVDGQPMTVIVKQDGTGSRLLSYGTAYEFCTALPSPTLSTSAGLSDYLGFRYSAAASKWRFLAYLPGFS